MAFICFLRTGDDHLHEGPPGGSCRGHRLRVEARFDAWPEDLCCGKSAVRRELVKFLGAPKVIPESMRK